MASTVTASFDGKVALITGGASGIGRATALAFADAGARMVVSDVNVSGGEETAAMVCERGTDARFVRCDVRVAAEVEALVSATVAAFGRVDCAFNNAGIARGSGIVELTEDEWDAVIDINLKGVWLCMKYQIPRMLEQGAGAIVNVASIYGIRSSPWGAVYSASKHGVVALTETAAVMYAAQGVRVNAICPGFIDTPMVEQAEERNPDLEGYILSVEPVGRKGRAEEIAAGVLWLCADSNAFVTGSKLVIDGGNTARA